MIVTVPLWLAIATILGAGTFGLALTALLTAHDHDARLTYRPTRYEGDCPACGEHNTLTVVSSEPVDG